MAQFFGSDVGRVTVVGKEVSKDEDKAEISLLEFLSVRGLVRKMESEEL